MPDFTYRGRLYHNPVEVVLDQLGGRWKMPILWRLREGRALRYGELRQSLAHCTDNMLANQLRELERDGYLLRTAYAEVPPRVEYRLTPLGERALPLVEHLRAFGHELMAAEQPAPAPG